MLLESMDSVVRPTVVKAKIDDALPRQLEYLLLENFRRRNDMSDSSPLLVCRTVTERRALIV